MRALRTSTNIRTSKWHLNKYEHFVFVSLIFKTSLIPDDVSGNPTSDRANLNGQ